MNSRWDTNLACEMCHKQHRILLSKKFHIWLQLTLDEAVLPKHVTDEVMNQMFIMHSHTVRTAIQNIIGEELLHPLALVFLYPSQVISIFLSNAMDLLQSLDMLQALARKVIFPHFLVDNKLNMAMQKYDLWNGMALVGGLFSHFQLLQKHEFYVVFEAMKKAIDTCSIIYLKHALPSDPRLMGVHVVERIMSVGLAMIELQKDSNFLSSI